MKNSGNKPKGSAGVAERKANNSTSKQERLAAELRANLKKRKASLKSGKEDRGR